MSKQYWSRNAAPALAGVVLSLATATAISAPIRWAGNGHYYDVIDVSGGIAWAGARAAAEATSYLGANGHLVSVTTAGENGFLTDTFGGDGLENRWLGLFQPIGSAEPDRGWTWVNGESFSYNNWWPGEPNNFGGDESAGVFQHGISSDGKAWNDLDNESLVTGYVIEFDVDAPRVPEPTTLMLLAGGLLGFGVARRR